MDGKVRLKIPIFLWILLTASTPNTLPKPTNQLTNQPNNQTQQTTTNLRSRTVWVPRRVGWAFLPLVRPIVAEFETRKCRHPQPKEARRSGLPGLCVDSDSPPCRRAVPTTTTTMATLSFVSLLFQPQKVSPLARKQATN